MCGACNNILDFIRRRKVVASGRRSRIEFLYNFDSSCCWYTHWWWWSDHRYFVENEAMSSDDTSYASRSCINMQKLSNFWSKSISVLIVTCSSVLVLFARRIIVCLVVIGVWRVAPSQSWTSIHICFKPGTAKGWPLFYCVQQWQCKGDTQYNPMVAKKHDPWHWHHNHDSCSLLL